MTISQSSKDDLSYKIVSDVIHLGVLVNKILRKVCERDNEIYAMRE